MELAKVSVKKHRPKVLSDITNTKKKSLSKKSSKHHSKANSNFKLEDLVGEKSLSKSREYFINLKETQIFNLAGAVKLNIENLKCRYRKLYSKLKRHDNKKDLIYSKILKLSPSPEYSKFNNDLSPISIGDSQYSGSSLTGIIDTKSSCRRKLDYLELEKKRKDIEDENSNMIVKEYDFREKRKKFASQKSKLIVIIGRLYEKKNLLIDTRLAIGKLVIANDKLKSKAEELKEKYKKIVEIKEAGDVKIRCNQIQMMCFGDSEKCIEEKRKCVRSLEIELEEKVEEIEEKERYLKEILGIKEKILKRVDNMKSFDRKLQLTRDVALGSMNLMSKIPKPSDSQRVLFNNNIYKS